MNKFKKIFSILLILMMGTFIAGCKGSKPLVDVIEEETQESSNLTEEFKGEGNFESLSFKYPSTWLDNGQGYSERVGDDVHSFTNIEGTDKNVITNISILYVDIVPGTEEEIYNVSVSSAKEFSDNVTTDYMEVNGCKLYGYTASEDSGDYDVYTTQYLISKDSKMYGITSTSLVSKDEDNLENIEELKNVLNTVNIN